MVLAWVLGTVVVLSVLSARADDVPVAVLAFDFYDTSLEGELRGVPDPAEEARLDALRERLADTLRARGYRIVDTSPIADKIRERSPIFRCNGCQIGLAKAVGARDVVTGWVQKVSNLILNMNVVIHDVESKAILRSGTVSLRGNTDESWDRSLRYLLKRRIFPDP